MSQQGYVGLLQRGLRRIYVYIRLTDIWCVVVYITKHYVLRKIILEPFISNTNPRMRCAQKIPHTYHYYILGFNVICGIH